MRSQLTAIIYGQRQHPSRHYTSLDSSWTTADMQDTRCRWRNARYVPARCSAAELTPTEAELTVAVSSFDRSLLRLPTRRPTCAVT